MKPNQLVRFMERYEISLSGCWNWIWKKDKDGYGLFHARPNHQKAHRFSYELHKGSIPPNMLVCHTCDNPSCVNPEHLWVGTVLDNNRDKENKGRGFSHYRGKTHCKRGHEFCEKTVYLTPRGTRTCKICRRYSLNKYKNKMKVK